MTTNIAIPPPAPQLPIPPGEETKPGLYLRIRLPAIALVSVLASSLPAWAQAHDPLQYSGGPVLRNFTIYPLYYGKWSDTDIDDKQKFLRGLAGYLSGQSAPIGQQPMMRQYGVTGATVATEQKASPDAKPKKLTDNDIRSIIHSNQNNGVLPSYSRSTLIFVFPATGFSLDIGGGCGYHGNESSSAFYATVPRDCDANTGNPGKEHLVTAHEVFEAAADPAFTGWTEAVDGCDSSSWVKLPFGRIPGAADNTQGGTCSTTGYTKTVLSGPCVDNDCWISALQIDPFNQQVKIDRPVVSQPSFEYKQLVFRSGDQIRIDAGGCVQTGGHGSTWKRYVDPSGPNSVRLYFGSLEIPGVLSKTRLSDLIGRAPVRVPTTVPTTFVSPVLYYADDTYSDNGYYAHDNGTGAQCDLAKDGGPAHVTLTIVHTTPLLSGPCGKDDCNISLVQRNDVFPDLGTASARAPLPPKKVEVDITRPVVTEGAFDYKSVVFRSGDTVAIDAGGCVQTGGHGRTWKRYVNPSGPNSDHLYFGSMEIPAVSDFGSGSPADILTQTRFSSLIGKPLVKVPNIASSTLATLVLHYTDDGYPDNGYYSHDDGTGNQCALAVDGGDAHITLTISTRF